jgi:hypothetical protein
MFNIPEGGTIAVNQTSFLMLTTHDGAGTPVVIVALTVDPLVNVHEVVTGGRAVSAHGSLFAGGGGVVVVKHA